MDDSSSSSSSSSASGHHGPLSMSDLEASLASCAACCLPPSSCGTGLWFADVHEGAELVSHFLDSCFLCGKSLAGNRDIFMYRGDTPFCSEECRQEQIEMDEASEKRRRLAVKEADSKEEPKKGAAAAVAGAEAQKIHVVAAAG